MRLSGKVGGGFRFGFGKKKKRIEKKRIEKE